MLRQSFLTILVLLACCVALMQGSPTSSRERCLCTTWRKSVKKNHMAEAQYYAPGNTCSREELVVTLKNQQKVCLTLQGNQGRKIKEEILKKRNAK